MNMQQLQAAARKAMANLPEGYFLDKGAYVLCDPTGEVQVNGTSVLGHKPQMMDYNQLSGYLFGGLGIPLFLNKKALKLHLNDPMTRKEVFQIRPYVNRDRAAALNLQDRRGSAADLWKGYAAASAEKRAEYDQYLQEHNEWWDKFEKISHGSLMTNEERWLAGRMDTQDYVRESIWRDAATYGKWGRMQEDLDRMRVQNMQMQQNMEQMRMEAHRRRMQTPNALTIIRVGHVIYCRDELIAVLLTKDAQPVIDYAYAPDADIAGFMGSCTNGRSMGNEIPAAIPAMAYLLQICAEDMPAYPSSSKRMENCPEDLWMIWSAMRAELSGYDGE